MAYTFYIWEKEKRGKEKRIGVTLEEITKKEAKCKKTLGIGAGMDIGHCIYLGSRHSADKDFLRSVRYYRYCDADEFPDMNRGCAAIIAFYKDKKGGI